MKKFNVFALLLVLLLTITSCASPQEHTTNVERDRVLAGAFDNDSNFFESQQIAEIEEWKDQPGKVVNLYLFDPVKGGLLVPPIQCKGVPASSTESVEPNEGMSDYWRYSGDDAHVPFKENIEGQEVFTFEMPGRDGTYGDPAPYRQCISYDGHYYDFPNLGVPYLVTSATYTFPDPTVERDIETELKIRQLEIVLENGGCVDFNRLVEIDCSEQLEVESSEVITQ
jgi:hypothetical protein